MKSEEGRVIQPLALGPNKTLFSLISYLSTLDKERRALIEFELTVEAVIDVDITVTLEERGEVGGGEVGVVGGKPALLEGSCPRDIELDTFGTLEGEPAGTDLHHDIITACEG